MFWNILFPGSIKNSGQGLTVLTVSSGGLSLMSVMLISAVAVLDKPKFRFPSMSVAWTMMVYWDTFCRRIKIKTHEENYFGLLGLTDATRPKARQIFEGVGGREHALTHTQTHTVVCEL